MHPLESPPAGESTVSRQIATVMSRNLTVHKRPVHPKHHALLHAQFCVELVPVELRVGIFAEPRAYPAYIRFSNSRSGAKHDGLRDSRGMAIKLCGITGPTLLDDERQTQDFLLNTHPVFFVANGADYLKFFSVSRSNEVPDLAHQFPELAKSFVPCPDLLRVSYFSQTPYAWGETAVKYRVAPVSEPEEESLDDDRSWLSRSPHYLREQLAERLATEEVRLTFSVQMCPHTTAGAPDPAVIEDATVGWTTPYHRVATITIPRQEFQSLPQMGFAEDISFNPWHCHPEHRPLGGINRLRREAYRHVAQLRRNANGVEPREPNGFNDWTPTVQHALNLVMTIKGRSDTERKAEFHKLDRLLQDLQSASLRENPVTSALDRLQTVHFARFVYLEPVLSQAGAPEWYRRLAVITTFDRDFDTYVLGFVDEIGEVFNAILQYMEIDHASGPVIPVQDHRDAFLRYVTANNLPTVGPLYSAYPNAEVADIKHAIAEHQEGGGR